MKQLTLVDTQSSWRLGARDREVGRAGIAKARAILAESRRRHADDISPTIDHPTAA